jgi:integrase
MDEATDAKGVVDRIMFPFNDDGYRAAGFMAKAIWNAVSTTLVAAVDEREMLNACYRLGLPELADWITFGIDSGMRRSEMLRLKTADCFSGHIHLHNGQTKNDQGRVIPTTELAEAIVQKARDKSHDRVFQGMTQAILRGQWDALRTYLKKDADPKYIVHVLRHTCATRLAIGGATAPQIMAYMGHKAIQTSMIYIHLTGHNLTGVADLLKRSPMARPELKVVGG